MAGFHHAPSSEEPRDPVAEQHNARVGLWLFFVYLAGYAVFVAVSAFWPAMMESVAFFGVNWAVTSGMVLIVGALILALIYAYLCRKPGGGSR